eukprot:TRINITY_DN4482_c0_g1_i5.p1 TRINITY_DN4482_c0_g1~~TRINITY_DN4482_c0_g1_i5.p1  ORF type:complete len:270 (-),score=78.99 TRINITY_DN4482_c0_g1_i5:43-774(-)
MSTTPSARKTIFIDITSDTICPWCTVGDRRLSKALQDPRVKALPFDFQIRWHPFHLDPTLDNTPLTKKERYDAKFGAARMVQMQKMMSELGKKEGINFSWGGNVRQTTDSHRLIQAAWDKGGETMQTAMVRTLFSGYFEQEKDIGDHEYLATAAESVGLMGKQEALDYLKTDQNLDLVKKEMKKAQMAGISGVPFFVLDNKYALSGAQEPDTFVEVIQNLAKEKGVQKQTETGGTCEGDTCRL